MLWIKNFSTEAMAQKKSPRGVRTIQTPENIHAVRQAVENSATRSAVKHAIAFDISD